MRPTGCLWELQSTSSTGRCCGNSPNGGETHPTVPLRESPDEWGSVIDDSAAWAELGAAHTAVDTPADYWALVDAVRAVGFDPREVTEWVAENR